MQIIGSPTPTPTQDRFVEALTIQQDTADTLSFVVANASAIMSLQPFARRGGAEIPYGPDLLVAPQVSPPIKNVSGVRFRSAVPGTPALVIAQLVGPEDPQVAGGTPFTQTLSASGAVGQIVVLQRVALANFPPATPQDGQEIALVVDATTEWHLIFNAGAGRWDWLGGPELLGEDLAVIATNAAAYTAVGNAFPVTLPRAGDYIVANGHTFQNNAAAALTSLMSYDIGATPASDNDASRGTTAAGAAGNNSMSVMGKRPKAGLGAVVLTPKVRVLGGANVSFMSRWLEAKPRFVT